LSPSNDVPWRVNLICIEDSRSALTRKLEALVQRIRTLGASEVTYSIDGRRYKVVGPVINP